MKIMIIGSTAYQDKMYELQDNLKAKGHEVMCPAFDDLPKSTSLDICLHNKKLVEWCDCVMMIWDARSDGTKFDMGMTIALNKPMKIIYINDKTLQKVFEEYAEKSKEFFKNNSL